MEGSKAMTDTFDLDAIRARSRRAIWTYPDHAPTVAASALNVPVLIAEVERLRASIRAHARDMDRAVHALTGKAGVHEFSLENAVQRVLAERDEWMRRHDDALQRADKAEHDRDDARALVEQARTDLDTAMSEATDAREVAERRLARVREACGPFLANDGSCDTGAHEQSAINALKDALADPPAEQPAPTLDAEIDALANDIVAVACIRCLSHWAQTDGVVGEIRRNIAAPDCMSWKTCGCLPGDLAERTDALIDRARAALADPPASEPKRGTWCTDRPAGQAWRCECGGDALPGIPWDTRQDRCPQCGTLRPLDTHDGEPRTKPQPDIAALAIAYVKARRECVRLRRQRDAHDEGEGDWLRNDRLLTAARETRSVARAALTEAVDKVEGSE